MEPLHRTDENRFNLLIQLGVALKKFPQIDFSEALSAGQVESKKWLIETLEKIDEPLGLVFLVAGWWGFLPAMLFESRVRLDKIRSFDIDPECTVVAETINRRYVRDDWKFKASYADMLRINFHEYIYATDRFDGSEVVLAESPDTIINTSCEHIVDFANWWGLIPEGKLVILQSNNFSGPAEHKNCVENVDKFAASAPMKKLLFSGELELPEYKRFMLIGRK